MTSTSVKDVGSAFANLYAGSAGNAGATTNAASFRQVWDSQVGKGSDASTTDFQTVSEDTSSDVEAFEADNQIEKPESRLEDAGKETEVEKEAVAENDVKTTAKSETSENENTELSEEEMNAAMEVMSAVATELMQNIADTFGVTMEELQATMDELGMTAVDALDGAKLGELMLQLGGAGDSYALVTDETLYDNYRMVMNEQKAALELIAKELGVEQSQLETMIAQELHPEAVVAEELPDEMLQQNPEADGTEVNVVVGTVDEMPMTKATEQTGTTTTDEGTGNRQSGRDGMASETSTAGQTTEFVAQNVTVENVQAQVQQTESVYASTSWDTDTQNIMRQIMDFMKIQVNAETTDLEMQLHPASLGTIRVNIVSNGGVMTANFVTENETVKAALESQMIQLRESFAEQGVKVEAIEVTVQTHEFEQNLEQGRGRNEQESGTRRNRTRRINLNDPLTMENMDEEDALAAEMLTADGSTVDYTA